MTLAAIAYAGRGVARPRYHSNDTSGDVLDIQPVQMDIIDARGRDMTLDGAGFRLCSHRSAVADFTDRAAVDAIYRQEIVDAHRRTVGRGSGAGEQSRRPALQREVGAVGKAGQFPAGPFCACRHQRCHGRRVCALGRRPRAGAWRGSCTTTSGGSFHSRRRTFRWRCATRAAVTPADLIPADAVFNAPDRPEWSFEGIVVAHHPAHRWHWFSDMTRDEALVFKTNDSDRERAHCVPHVAFDNPDAGSQVAPRASIEMRAIALWFG